MKKQSVLIVLLISTSLAGCAGGPRIKMKDENRKSFHTVSIDSEVALPDNIYFSSSTQKVMNNFGLFGMAIGSSDKKRAKKELMTVLQSGRVSVPDLVRSAFRDEMAKRTPYKPLKSGARADARMTMKVTLFGFESIGIGKKFYPDLYVTAEIKNGAGKAISRNHGRINPLNKKIKASYTFEQMLAKPARMRQMLVSAARLAASEALADF